MRSGWMAYLALGLVTHTSDLWSLWLFLHVGHGTMGWLAGVDRELFFTFALERLMAS